MSIHCLSYESLLSSAVLSAALRQVAVANWTSVDRVEADPSLSRDGVLVIVCHLTIKCIPYVVHVHYKGSSSKACLVKAGDFNGSYYAQDEHDLELDRMLVDRVLEHFLYSQMDTFGSSTPKF